MAGTFDPYHKWLGISAKDQPPNFYRLLNIELFESDPDVIEGAADRQMAHVRTFQTGQHSADSQRLLNELSAARIWLLDPEKRAAYDQLLRAQTASRTPAIEAEKTSIDGPVGPPPSVSIAPAKAVVLAAIPVQATHLPPDWRDEPQPSRSGTFWKQPATIALLLTLSLLFLSGMGVAVALRGHPTLTNSVADSGINQTNPASTVTDKSALSGLAEKSEKQGTTQELPGDSSTALPAISSSDDEAVEPTNRTHAEHELATLAKLGAKIGRADNSSEQRIVQIDLSRTAVVDTDLALLRAFPGLIGLRLDGTQITDAGLKPIEALPDLQTLSLRETHVTDEGLSCLETLSKLNSLDVRKTRVTAVAVLSLRRRSPKLNVIFDPPPMAATVTSSPAAGSELGPPVSKEPDVAAMVRKFGGSTRRDLKLSDKPVVELRIDNDVVTDDDLEFLAGLTALISLELHGVRLTDKALSCLRSLTSLTSLTIDRARLTDEGLEHLAELKRLISLRITRAPITDAGLKHLRELSDLEVLDLAETQVTGSGLGQLRAPHLETLVLDRTNVNDKTTAAIVRFANLHKVSLQDTVVGDRGLVRLKRMKALKDLDISRTRVTDEGVKQYRKGAKGGMTIRRVTAANSRRDALVPRGPDAGGPARSFELTPAIQLAMLSLQKAGGQFSISRPGQSNAPDSVTFQGQQLTDAALADIKALPFLTRVSFWNCPNVTDAGMEHLAELRTLQELTLRRTGTTDNGLERLRALSNLTSLQLLDLRITTTAPLLDLHKLKKLKLWNMQLSAEALAPLSKLEGLTEFEISLQTTDDRALRFIASLHKLTRLNMVCPGATDASLEHLSALHDLRSLTISIPVTDSGLAHLNELNQLSELHVYEASLSDDGVRSLCGHRALRELSLHSPNVDDDGAKHLDQLAQMERLDLARTGISDAGVRIFKNMGRLTFLDLTATKVTDEGLKYLSKCLGLVQLRLNDTAIGDDGVAHLSTLPSLQLLSLDKTHITDRGLAHCARLASLRSLSLRNTQVTETAAARLREEKVNLQINR